MPEIVPRTKPCIRCDEAFNPIDWNAPTIKIKGRLYYDSRCSNCFREWQRIYKKRVRYRRMKAKLERLYDANH